MECISIDTMLDLIKALKGCYNYDLINKIIFLKKYKYKQKYL